MRDSFQKLGISFDIYHRTSSLLHHKTSQDFFLKLYNNGIFEEKETEQYYDEEFKQFLADRYITGTCPKCGNPNAYGDQCERCGSSLSPDDLINPVSVLSKKTPVKKKTKHWYLPLNKFQGWLTEWIIEGKGRKEEWKKNVLGQCISWIQEGLQPRAITRDLDWGVKVPLPDAAGKVLYVWLDAPIGYISATMQWAIDNQKNWEPYWKSDDTKLVHFIGKDNIVFHCLIFPCILKSHGEFILPTNVPANEFMNMEGDKMSTSRNWSVQLHKYLEEFPGKEDVLRYVLCANMPETKDSEFTWRDFQARNNNELVAILGNFVNRVTVLTEKYCGGKIPAADKQVMGEEYFINYNAEINRIVTEEYIPALENYRFRDALTAMMDVARLGNKLLTDHEPWKLIKTDPERTHAILRICLESIADLALLAEPFLPFSAEKMARMLHISLQDFPLQTGTVKLTTGSSIGERGYLFEKIEDAIITWKLEELDAIRKSREGEEVENEIPSEEKNQKPEITYPDFAKLDIRTGIIIQAEKIPGADKLLKLLIDIGTEKRTIVSGIAEYYQPEEITGKKVSVVVNLAPKKMRGVESRGMILMAEDASGKLYFVHADTDDTGLNIS